MQWQCIYSRYAAEGIVGSCCSCSKKRHKETWLFFQMLDYNQPCGNKLLEQTKICLHNHFPHYAMLNYLNLGIRQQTDLCFPCEKSLVLLLQSNSISSSDKPARGFVQSDRGSLANNLSEQIKDSAAFTTPAWFLLHYLAACT